MNNEAVELRIPHPKELFDYEFVQVQIQIQQLLKPTGVLDAQGNPNTIPDGIMILCAMKIPHEHVEKFVVPKLKVIEGMDNENQQL